MNDIEVHFIVGPHRSGTTYLQTLIGAMPGVASGVETHFFCRVKPYVLELAKTKKNKILFSDIRRGIEAIIYPREVVEIDWDFIEVNWLTSGWCGVFKSLIYSSFITSGSKSASVWIEKTPSHLMWIEEIQMCFSKAKFLVMYRDPRAIAVSFLKHLSHPTLCNRLSWLKKEVKYLHHFWGVISKYKDGPLQSSNFLFVRYEDLFEKPLVKLREICSFLNIEYSHPNHEALSNTVATIISAGETHKSENKIFDRTDRNIIPWSQKVTFIERIYIELSLLSITSKYGYKSNYPLYVFSERIVKIVLKFINLIIPNWKSETVGDELLNQYVTKFPPYSNMRS